MSISCHFQDQSSQRGSTRQEMDTKESEEKRKKGKGHGSMERKKDKVPYGHLVSCLSCLNKHALACSWDDNCGKCKTSVEKCKKRKNTTVTLTKLTFESYFHRDGQKQAWYMTWMFTRHNSQNPRWDQDGPFQCISLDTIIILSRCPSLSQSVTLVIRT